MYLYMVGSLKTKIHLNEENPHLTLNVEDLRICRQINESNVKEVWMLFKGETRPKLFNLSRLLKNEF